MMRPGPAQSRLPGAGAEVRIRHNPGAPAARGSAAARLHRRARRSPRLRPRVPGSGLLLPVLQALDRHDADRLPAEPGQLCDTRPIAPRL